jgi:hypothetical protein
MPRIHPLTAVTALVFLVLLLGNFFTLDWQKATISSALGALILASPFVVFIEAHQNIARTWRRHAYLAAGSVLFIVPSTVLSFLLRWFQPGVIGLGLAGIILVSLAYAYAYPARWIKEH